MKKLVIPCSRCQARLALAGPVATEADLHVAPGSTMAVRDEPVHRRAVRDLDAEDLRRPCPYGCRSGRARRRRAGPRHARMSGSAIEWSPPSTTGTAPASTTCRTSLDRARVPRGVGGDHRSVAEVDDAQESAQSTPRLQMRSGRAARRRGSRAARTACPGGRRRGRPSARRGSRRRRPRARPGPACTACPRT